VALSVTCEGNTSVRTRFTAGQIAKSDFTVHADNIMRHRFGRQHLRTIQFVVQRICHRGISESRLFQQPVDAFCIELINDDCGSGHRILRVIQEPVRKRKPSPKGKG
jgi:hypothetical protein